MKFLGALLMFGLAASGSFAPAENLACDQFKDRTVQISVPGKYYGHASVKLDFSKMPAAFSWETDYSSQLSESFDLERLINISNGARTSYLGQTFDCHADVVACINSARNTQGELLNYLAEVHEIKDEPAIRCALNAVAMFMSKAALGQ